MSTTIDRTVSVYIDYSRDEWCAVDSNGKRYILVPENKYEFSIGIGTTKINNNNEMEKQGMNYSAVISLVDDTVHGIKVTYEDRENAPEYTYKSRDSSIKAGDYVVVPTSSRHKMTVVKVTGVDAPLDYESSIQYNWIISKFDKSVFDETVKHEKAIIDAAQEAEALHKREELKNKLSFLSSEKIKALAITHVDVGGI